MPCIDTAIKHNYLLFYNLYDPHFIDHPEHFTA